MNNRGTCLALPGAGAGAGAADAQSCTSTRPRVRLSPNEEAQLAQEELDRRRKLRLQQVREQQRYLAVCVRRRVDRRRRGEEARLEQLLRHQWQQQHTHQKDTLSQELTHTLSHLGHAYASAKENEPDWAGLAQKKAEQKGRAAQRHAQALRELRTHTHTQEQQRTRHMVARRKALEVEKERAAAVANLPPPPPHPIESVLKSVPPQKKLDVVELFSSSHHHLPGPTVETHTLQADAKEAAEEEAKRLDELHQEVTRDRVEQLEKARLRGEHALRKEHLTQERQRMLLDLERMQAADWLRRRQALHQAPPPTGTHTHAVSPHTPGLADERQRVLEHAFQDLYTNERRVKGDLVLQLVPEPLPDLSTSSHDNDLDVTVESNVTALDEGQEEAEPADIPGQSHGLRRLLDRIRCQRELWNSASARPSQHAAPGPIQQVQGEVATTTQISNGAGPMATQQSSGDVAWATELSDGAAPMVTQQSDGNIATTQQSDGDVAMTTQLSEDCVGFNGISLETGSLTSTHTPNAGVREDFPLEQEKGQSDTPRPQEEETLQQDSTAQGAPACAAEDSHIHRIHQYQQQLLEQSRLHRQCVEEARRRLDEYQRTLTLRHNTVTMATIPSTGRVLPPSLVSMMTPLQASTVTKTAAAFVPMATATSAITSVDKVLAESSHRIHAVHTHTTHTTLPERTHTTHTTHTTLPERTHTTHTTLPDRVHTTHTTLPDRVHTTHTTLPDRVHTTHTTLPDRVHTTHTTLPERVHTAHTTLPERTHTTHTTLPERTHTTHTTLPERTHTTHTTLPERTTHTTLPERTHTTHTTLPERVHTTHTTLPERTHTTHTTLPERAHTTHTHSYEHTSVEALPLPLHSPAPALPQVLSDPAPALPQVLSDPAPALPQVLSTGENEGEEPVGSTALPPPAVVLELLRSRQQESDTVWPERCSLMSALLRAIQDSRDSANQGARSSPLANQGARSSPLANQGARSSPLASQSSRNASVSPLANVVSQNSVHDWHQLSAIIEVDTPLNSTAPEESMCTAQDSESPSVSDWSSVSLQWPTHSHTHTHTQSSGSLQSHTHTHTQSSSGSLQSHTHTQAQAATHTHSGRHSRLSWRDTLRLHSAPPSTVAAPDSAHSPRHTSETEMLSPVDPGSFTTTISTGSYCPSSAGTDPSPCAGAGVGVVSPVGSSHQCKDISEAVVTECRLPSSSKAENIIERHRVELLRSLSQAQYNTGLRSRAQMLQNEPVQDASPGFADVPSYNISPAAESSVLQDSAIFLPLQPQTDSSLLSSSLTHLQRDQDWDDTVSRIIGQLSRFTSTSSQSDVSLPHHASTSNQSDVSLPHHASTSNQSDVSVPHQASISSQSDLSQLIGPLSSQSYQSASGSEPDGRDLAESACCLIGQISEHSSLHGDRMEESRASQLIGQRCGEVAEGWDSGAGQLIGQCPTLQDGPPDHQQSSDSFHPLEAELTMGHLSADSEDDPSLLRADSTHLSQQAVQDSLFQRSVSLDPLLLSNSSLHDNQSFQEDQPLPASPAHTLPLVSQSGEELPAPMPLWERIMDLDSGRGILEESMLSLVSESDITLQSSFHEEELAEDLEASHTHTSMNAPPTHTSHTRTQEEHQHGEEEMTQASLLWSPQDKEGLLLAGECELKRVMEVKISPKHRDVYTHRLYNQLDEKRQRKEMHCHQATSILNNQRAREFQQKTLQKLWNKQTHPAKH